MNEYGRYNGYKAINDRLIAEGLSRSVSGQYAPGLLDLTSNDYLGIAGDTAVREAFLSSEWNRNFGSKASRLLVTDQEPYLKLENLLQETYGKPAVIFNSGYHANVGLVSSLAMPGTLILADKLVHASIIDGILLSKCQFQRFRHNDIEDLRAKLVKFSPLFTRIVMIVESVYSMDGDLAPLTGIADLRREFPNTLLYVDEAHSVGVFGEKGLGISAEQDLLADVDILVGTFGKALASVGAFAIMDESLRQFVVNKARPLIFSTALPPANVSYTHYVFEQMMHMDASRRHLKSISSKMKKGLEQITGQSISSDSQILPLIIGDNFRTCEFSNRLQSRGILALPIRVPTVKAGTERIRFSLNSSLTDEDINHVLCTIEDCYEG